MNVWPDVAESHASLKVYLMDNAAGKDEKEIAEDGSLKDTATSNGHDRYAVYFVDGNKPMAVRIEVTSENGEVDNYYLVISKASSADDAQTLLNKIKADNEAADKAAADAVSGKISAIGAVTPDSQTAVEETRAAYNALTVTQRKLVTNLNVLTDAEAALKTLMDQAAADTVFEMIAAIGTVTKDSQAAIEAARAAYNALTDDQKALVTNYKALATAEKEFEEISKAVAPDQTGDTALIIPFALMMTTSAACLVVLILCKKKYAK